MSDTQRQDQGSVQLTVDGKEAPMVFNKRDGGKTDSEGQKTHPGNMLRQKAHGGPQTIEDLTLEGEFVPARDNDFIQWLKSRCGKGKAGVVENILDVDGNVWGRGDSWTGILKSVSTGTYDSSSSAPKAFVIEVETDGAGA